MKRHVFLLAKSTLPKNLSKEVDAISPKYIQSLSELPQNQPAILIIYQDSKLFPSDSNLTKRKEKNPYLQVILLIDSPDRDLYRNYLESKIDYPIHIYDKYQNFLSNFKFILAETKEQFPRLNSSSIELDPNTKSVKLNSHPLKLRKKEYELLKYLMLKKGRVATKTELLENVWQYRYDVFTKTVDTHIHHLKKKVNKEKDIIQTIYGQGYQLAPEEVNQKLIFEAS